MSAETAPASAAQPPDLPRLCRPSSEMSPQPTVAVAGPAHSVRYLNPAFARLAGKPPERLLGRPFAEAAPGPPGAACLAALDRVLLTAAPEHADEQEREQTPAAAYVLIGHLFGSGILLWAAGLTAAICRPPASDGRRDSAPRSSVRP